MISSGRGIVGEKREGIIQNCYYDVSKSSSGYSSSNVEENGIIGKTTQEMQSDDFINLLNSDVFSKDIENINNGYPIIEVFKCMVDYSIKTPTNQNVIVNITSINQLQELDGWELSSDKKTLTKEYTENVKETILVSDVEENEKQINIEINNIDKTAPNESIKYSTKNPTKENVIVTITSNEEIQEVEGWTLSSDKRVLTKKYSVNIKETITIKDLAGNEAESNIEISNIDKAAPNMNVEYSTKEPTNRNVTVTITSNEEMQEVEGWTLSSDKRVLTKEYTENTKETITVKDLAGNEAQVNIEITNIDKTLPDITIGDINQDEKIDVTDLLMLKRHLVAGSRESWKITGDSLLATDMNEDGNVDVTDMLMLKRIIVEDM